MPRRWWQERAHTLVSDSSKQQPLTVTQKNEAFDKAAKPKRQPAPLLKSYSLLPSPKALAEQTSALGINMAALDKAILGLDGEQKLKAWCVDLVASMTSRTIRFLCGDLRTLFFNSPGLHFFFFSRSVLFEPCALHQVVMLFAVGIYFFHTGRKDLGLRDISCFN